MLHEKMATFWLASEMPDLSSEHVVRHQKLDAAQEVKTGCQIMALEKLVSLLEVCAGGEVQVRRYKALKPREASVQKSEPASSKPVE
ncbi:MAG: hypothetical protein ACI8WM_002199 [Burkholderiaceae bacterium]|jgi:hypothetical protein